MVAWNLLIIPLAALIRSVCGWLENSFKDKEIEVFEWQQLGATVFRMGLPIVALIYAFDMSPEVASGIGIFIDWIVVKMYSALS